MKSRHEMIVINKCALHDSLERNTDGLPIGVWFTLSIYCFTHIADMQLKSTGLYPNFSKHHG